MLRLKLLGGATLEDGSGTVAASAAQRHSIALLALLASSGSRGMSRGKLVGYLWPEVPEDTARNRLSTHLHRLRRAMAADAVVSAGGELFLNDGVVTSDLGHFTGALEAGDPAAAVEVYDGPFLDGFVLEGSVAFDHWMDRERDRLRQRYREALVTLARQAEAEERWEAAVRRWRARVEDDALDSGITARLMEALVASGNPAGALEAARAHEALLQEEFGTGPGDEVMAVVRRIRDASSRAGGATGPSAPDPRTIAVLPFRSVGDVPEAEIFATGLHQDLLTRLSRLRDLRLISRDSVLRYRDRAASMGQIGEDLGVGTVVEGTVQRAGDRVRLNVWLLDVADDAHRWAETYDRRLTAEDLFEIQTELAEKIAEILRTELDVGRDGLPLARGAPTADLEAYRLHVEGRARLDERTEAGMKRAEVLFREALDHDPGYTLAWVGLADALALLYEYGYAEASVLDAAEAAARRAIELDPGLGAAHTSLGLLHEARHEGPQAIRAYRRAVEIQPGYADAHNWLSWTNQNLGRAREALEASRRAVALNPLAPEVVGNLSVTMLMTGDAEGALREARRARSLEPDETTAVLYEALALQRLDRLEEAEGLLEGLEVPWAGSGPRATLALVHAERGEKGRARELLEGFEATEDWVACGLALAALGELDRAFQYFARTPRWPYWPTLALHHHFPDLLSGLRADVRFPDLLGRVRRFWGLNPDGTFPRGG